MPTLDFSGALSNWKVVFFNKRTALAPAFQIENVCLEISILHISVSANLDADVILKTKTLILEGWREKFLLPTNLKMQKLNFSARAQIQYSTVQYSTVQSPLP